MSSVAMLLAALQVVAPNFGPKLEAAQALHKFEEDLQIDGLLLAVVAEHESHWDSSVVGKLGELGITQIMPSNYVSCRLGPQEVCDARKRTLVDWRFNLNEAAELMASQRNYCKRVVGSGRVTFWLQEFQGYRSTCGHVKLRDGRWHALPTPKVTRDVLARWRELRKRFG